MKHDIQLAVFNISGTTVKDNGEITEAFQQKGFSIPSNKIAAVMGYKLHRPDFIIDSLKELQDLL